MSDICHVSQKVPNCKGVPCPLNCPLITPTKKICGCQTCWEPFWDSDQLQVQGKEVVTGETRSILHSRILTWNMICLNLALPIIHILISTLYTIGMCSFTYFTFHNRPSPEKMNASNSLDKIAWSWVVYKLQ